MLQQTSCCPLDDVVRRVPKTWRRPVQTQPLSLRCSARCCNSCNESHHCRPTTSMATANHKDTRFLACVVTQNWFLKKFARSCKGLVPISLHSIIWSLCLSGACVRPHAGAHSSSRRRPTSTAMAAREALFSRRSTHSSTQSRSVIHLSRSHNRKQATPQRLNNSLIEVVL